MACSASPIASSPCSRTITSIGASASSAFGYRQACQGQVQPGALLAGCNARRHECVHETAQIVSWLGAQARCEQDGLTRLFGGLLSGEHRAVEIVGKLGAAGDVKACRAWRHMARAKRLIATL